MTKDNLYKIGIVIDAWKLPIFKSHLDKVKLEYEESPGVTNDTLLLSVYTDNIKFVEVICRDAAKEAARKKYV